jgi:BspA type Leucine rich repeat region (6 copies)
MKNSIASRSWITLMGFLVLTLPVELKAQFTFTTNNGSITITGYTGSDGNVVIPPSINGYPVTSIGNGAFYLTTIINVTIPNSVTSIGDDAFADCTSLTSVTIPNSVTIIGDYAFYGCTSLTNITVDAQSVFYSSVNGVLFDKSQTTLVEYPAGLAGNYTIPNSVTSIGAEAFFYCSSLTSVTIGNGVTSIGQWAFAYCSSLTSVTIPNSVTSIGNGAFTYCYNLTSVTIGNSLTSIGDAAFSYCSGLTNIAVNTANPSYASSAGVLFNKSLILLIQYPGGLVGSYAIPNSVTSIGDYAFYGCTGLTSVTIPNSVTSIGQYAFSYCSGLTSVTIGNSVTSIGNGAFTHCYNLTNVTIPNSVTSIGQYAFYGCTSLAAVFFAGNAPSDDGTVFDGDPAKVYYLPGTTGWGSTFGSCPTAQWYLPNPLILSQNASFGMHSNLFGFTISWATNISVVVEACTNLADPVWQRVQTNTLTGGTNYFRDSNWTNYPARFYRVSAP